MATSSEWASGVLNGTDPWSLACLSNFWAALRLSRPFVHALQAAYRLARSMPKWETFKPSQIVEQLEGVSPLTLYAMRLDGLPANLDTLLDQYIHRWRKIEPFTGGEDLRLLGLQPGPAYRDILAKLRSAWINGEIASAEAEQAMLLKLLKG